MDEFDIMREGAEILSRLAVRDQAGIALASLAGQPFDEAALAAIGMVKDGPGYIGRCSGRLSAREFCGLFGCLDQYSQRRLREELEERSPGSVMRIEDGLFYFEELAELDPVSVHIVLGEIDDRTVMLALKGASPGLRVVVLAGLGPDRAHAVKDLLESAGPVPFEDVEGAQRAIESVVRRLEDEGAIERLAKAGS